MPLDGRPCPVAWARDWPRLVLAVTCPACRRRAHVPVAFALGRRWCGPETRLWEVVLRLRCDGCSTAGPNVRPL